VHTAGSLQNIAVDAGRAEVPDDGTPAS